MKLLFFGILSTLFLMSSCKNATKSNPQIDIKEEKSSSTTLTEADISKIKYIDFILDEKGEKLAKDWASYSKLVEIIEQTKRADFSFFLIDKEDFFEFIKNLKKEIPQGLKSPATESRVKVIETMLYQMQEAVNLSTTKKLELKHAIEDLLIAFSSLNFQLNKKLEKENQKIVRPI